MRILPSALEWRSRIRDKELGQEIPILLQSPLTQAFAGAYVWPRCLQTEVAFGDEAKLDKFPLETLSGESAVTQAEAYFGAEHDKFFQKVGFPLTAQGRFQALVFSTPRKNSTIFLAPHDPWEDTYEGYFRERLWKGIAKEFYDLGIPMLTTLSFVPPIFARSLASYAYIDTGHPATDIWYWVTQLLYCRMYLGAQSAFAELANLLGIPRIILDDAPYHNPPANQSAVRYLGRGAQWEGVRDAYSELGRNQLLSD